VMAFFIVYFKKIIGLQVITDNCEKGFLQA